MSDISEQNIQFWQRIFNKAFWLGVVGVAALGLNTALEVQKKLKKNKSKKKPSTIESPGNLAGIADDIADNITLGPSRKNSMMDFNDPHQVHRIVFTGGPCGGKTTAITSCSETLKEMGNDVISVPEAASLIFSSGGVLNMETYTPYQGIEFQKALMKLQMSLEDIFTQIVTINCQSKHVYVLCDRGLMDGSAYLSQEQWEVLQNELGLFGQDLRENRYDQVIHMMTAADGAEQSYSLGNNQARSEDIKTSIELDKKLRDAWMAHPNYFLINNDVKDFDSKVRMAEKYALKLQGNPSHSKFSRKYLINNKGDLFNRIIENFRVGTMTITDTYLYQRKPRSNKNAEIEVIYIRKRVSHKSYRNIIRG